MDIEAPIAARQPSAWVYVEQQLYNTSPVGALATTAIFYVALIGAYALAAVLDHHAWIVHGKAGAEIDRRAWIAVCLTLVVCAVLGMQRYSHLADMRDEAAFARAVRPGVALLPSFPTERLLRFSIAGVIGGAAIMLWFLTLGPSGRDVGPAIAIWFTAMLAILGALFMRGLVLTGAAARHNGEIFRHGLAIDLLRVERLYPFGRAAGRTAAIWFTVSAASLLLFVGADMAPVMVGLSVVCAAIGAWVFVGALGRIRQAIRAAKSAELEAIRHEITGLKAQLHADPAAAPKLQSLLAYESRIAAVHEWPFDQSTLARVAASSLVLAIPWFGQAFAGALVERFSGLLR